MWKTWLERMFYLEHSPSFPPSPHLFAVLGWPSDTFCCNSLIHCQSLNQGYANILINKYIIGRNGSDMVHFGTPLSSTHQSIHEIRCDFFFSPVSFIYIWVKTIYFSLNIFWSCRNIAERKSCDYGNLPWHYINPSSAGTIFIRHNLTSVDVRLWRIKTPPHWKN